MNKINIMGGVGILNGDVVLNQCRCGSGEPWFPLYDARGIFCQSVCKSCEKKVMQKYRTEIFSDPNYDCDEQIHPD